ncbi:hypothetical protein CVT26_002491 [Gymnopilus dilepis]|uniref:Uncharacterized protein n=1 Tax=Gymnopilus dilepis TaxID=231916 RepID=A0A409Y3N2_9AGAR|nr:hypothetical protein CVT26_002491 [Gymnopilus dilepis]
MAIVAWLKDKYPRHQEDVDRELKAAHAAMKTLKLRLKRHYWRNRQYTLVFT